MASIQDIMRHNCQKRKSEAYEEATPLRGRSAHTTRKTCMRLTGKITASSSICIPTPSSLENTKWPANGIISLIHQSIRPQITNLYSLEIGLKIFVWHPRNEITSLDVWFAKRKGWEVLTKSYSYQNSPSWSKVSPRDFFTSSGILFHSLDLQMTLSTLNSSWLGSCTKNKRNKSLSGWFHLLTCHSKLHSTQLHSPMGFSLSLIQLHL